MTLLDPPVQAEPRVTSLSLDFGTDAQDCAENAVEFSEQAMHMRSRWHFELGTQLAVSFVCQHDPERKRRLTAEGIVVGCEPCHDQARTWQSTVLFLELPDDLKQCLRELSHRRQATS